MKHLHKPIGQCLVTAIVTSAVLEAYALPLLGAQNPAVAPVQSTELNESPDASAAANPAVAAPATSLPAPSAVASPEAIAPIEANAAATTIRVEAIPVEAIPVEAAPAVTLPSETTAEPPRPIATEGSPEVAPPGASVSNLDAARQHLADKLAEIVEQEKASREAEFQQNLVASALHYARTGEFDRARQVAQHPALPLEMQTATLAKITEIVAGATLEPEAAPTTATVAKEKITSPAASVVPTVPVAGAWGMPTGAQPIFHAGDRCLVAPPATPAIATTASTTPAKSTPTNPLISLQAVSSAANGVLTALQQLDTAQVTPALTAPAATSDPITEAVTLNPTPEAVTLNPTPEAVTPELQDFPPMTVTLKQNVMQPSPTNTPLGLNLDQVVGATLKTSLQKLGLTLPLTLPISLKTLVSQWVAPLPEVAPPLPQATTEQLGDRLSESTLQPTWLRDTVVPLELGLSEAAVTTSQTALFPVAPDLPSIPKTFDKAVAPSPSAEPAAATVPTPEIPLMQATATVDCGGMTWGSLDPGQIVHSTVANQMARLGMRFPLAMPAALTSLFGWRIHPISGDRRFHAGIDLGAPMGTPVVAAVSGRVVTADYLGGYGLTVVLENGSMAQRNLYAHLSGIAVQHGTWVEQGAVIGWVGSTGNSTGPHLHFEVQRLTTNGWVAVDPLATTAVTLAQHAD